MESKLRYLAEHFPVVIVCGARQVGKTTLLQQIKKESLCRFYLTALKQFPPAKALLYA